MFQTYLAFGQLQWAEALYTACKRPFPQLVPMDFIHGAQSAWLSQPWVSVYSVHATLMYKTGFSHVVECLWFQRGRNHLQNHKTKIIQFKTW